MYFGTYTGFKFVSHSATQGVGESRSKGIYVSRLNSATGEMSEPQLAAEILNPSFLAVDPDSPVSLRGRRRPSFPRTAARSRILRERLCH